MRNIFLILLLFPIISFGQFVLSDTIKLTATGISVIQFGVWAMPTHRDTVIHKPDTVRVIMLLSDSSFMKNFSSIAIVHFGNGESDTVGYSKNRANNLWWQFGYMVNYYGTYIDGEYPKYLDENKKSLSKNIVVWLSKEIK